MAWLRAIGLFRGFWLVSLIPLSTGAMLAWWQGARFSFPLFFLSLLSVWAVHIGANLINDYYDHVSGTDDINEVRTPFSGGTRVIQDRLLAPSLIRFWGYFSFAVGMILLALLTTLTGWPILVLACLGIGAGIAYSAQPFWLAYRGFGELTIGLTFGPFLVATGFYVQAGRLSVQALIGGIFLGLFSAAIITINEVPDREADEKAGKRTLVVRFGKRFGLALWSAMLWASMILIAAATLVGMLPMASLGVLALCLPIAALTINANAKTEKLEGIVSRCRFTILSQVGAWILFNLSLLVSRGLA